MFSWKGSIPLGRIAGIRIGAHPSWLAFLVVMINGLSAYFQNRLGVSTATGLALSVAAVVLFQISLLLHEFGHALVARRLGVGIIGIDLWFFGGVARLSSGMRSPSAEFKMVGAGPAVTLVITVACATLATWLGGGGFFDVVQLGGVDGASAAVTVLGYVATINAVMFVFNLLPIYPLDGGQLTHALIWKLTGERLGATRVAGRIGIGGAALLIAFGIFQLTRGTAFTGFYIIAIGALLGKEARAVVASMAYTERIDSLTAVDVMDARPVRLALRSTATVLQARDEYFAPHGWTYFPVVDEHTRLLGVVTGERVEAEIAAGRSGVEVGAVIDAGKGERWCVRPGRSLESLLWDDDLRTQGSLLAVGADGVLRGVVTAEAVRVRYNAAVRQA